MVLIGSETLSVGQNLQDADYLINIDLPWNPMMLEQRIGRIDRPKQHQTEKIYIYYANSESQLLRQASRLANLNKKLVGDLVDCDGSISNISDVNALGASIYGDTLFDDAILPGYVIFLQSLVKARKLSQESFQESIYQKQNTSRDLYTQHEILFSEDVSQRIRALGEDYQANPIAIGQGGDQPLGLLALTIKYFGPNGEALPDKQELVFWNDQTSERDGYGRAIAVAANTPAADKILTIHHLLDHAQTLYSQLVILKHQRAAVLAQPETLENITLTSERLNKIQQRINTLNVFPKELDKTMVRETLKKLNAWKGTKLVQKLLRDYTEGTKTQLETSVFATQLVQDTSALRLLPSEDIKPTSLQISLSALLLRS
jgi:hypothetical protein